MVSLSYTLEPETVFMKFWSHYFKSIVLSHTLNGSLAQVHDLVTLHLVIWKYSYSYLDLLNVDTFHCTRSKKVTFVNTTTGLIRKVLIKVGSCQNNSNASFSKSWFSLESLDLSSSVNTINCFLWSERLTLFLFKKISARYQSLNNHSWSAVLSDKNGIAWRSGQLGW